MVKWFQHIIVWMLLLFSIGTASAQIAMPDTVCVGITRVYQVNDAATPSTYTWKIGGVTQSSTSHSLTVTWNTAGVYQLTVQEHALNGCDGDIRSGLVVVNPLPIANAGNDVNVCAGKNIQLNGSGGSTYQWSPPTYLSSSTIANPSLVLPSLGTLTYSLMVTDANGCKALKSDTMLIHVLPSVNVFAGRDTSIAVNQPLQLNATDPDNAGFISYMWSPPFGLNNSLIKSPIAILNRDITYIVTATTADGCKATDDINIRIFQAPEVFVPNAFTPNHDGLNDLFRPVMVGIRELKYFIVYNRYGQEIYRTSTIGAGWDGMVKGQMQNTGSFVWAVEAIDYRGISIKKNGSVILIK